MPTGYTAGILDGSITTFQQFARKCLRAFVIHMRDDPNDMEYYERKPSNYHTKEIKSAKKRLETVRKATDEEIISLETKRLKEDRKYHIKANKESIEDKKKLESFLKKSKSYSPPTKKHEGVKNFMIEQLQSTIDQDGNNSYHLKNLEEIDNRLNDLDPISVREEMTKSAVWDLAHHTESNEKEIKNSADTNKWVKDFMDSINPQ